MLSQKVPGPGMLWRSSSKDRQSDKAKVMYAAQEQAVKDLQQLLMLHQGVPGSGMLRGLP